MNDIKMSDVFDQLAVVSGRELESWELRDVNGNFYALFYNHQACISVAKAINAYDANQAEIAHWKSNHDNVVKKLREFTARPDLKISKQQERITELEAALQEVIYHFESGNGDHSDLNDGMIPKLKELINGQWSETKCET